MICINCGSNNVTAKKVISGTIPVGAVYRNHCNTCNCEWSTRSKEYERQQDLVDEDIRKESLTPQKENTKLYPYIE